MSPNQMYICLPIRRQGPPYVGDSKEEGGGAGSERIHPGQNKRDRSLLNTLEGSDGQDSKAQTVHHEAVGVVGSCRLRGKSEEIWEYMDFPFFDTCAQL